MARQYDVEGTKNFLIGGLICLALGVWHVRDGWFPLEKTIAKHPLGTDTFYLYNQTAGVGLCVVAVVCLYIHWVVK